MRRATLCDWTNLALGQRCLGLDLDLDLDLEFGGVTEGENGSNDDEQDAINGDGSSQTMWQTPIEKRTHEHVEEHDAKKQRAQ